MITVLLHLWGSMALAQQPPTAAVVQQDVLPALAARTARANARVTAANAWFSGRASFEEAWPGLAGVDVLDAGFLRATRQRMAEEAERRAGERIAPLPEDARLARSLSRTRATALDAEDRFASLEERLIASLQAGLSRAPGLEASTVAPYLAELDTRQRLAGPEASEEDNKAAAAALEDRRHWVTARRAAVEAFTVSGSKALSDWSAQTDATVPPVALLQAMMPLLEGDFRAKVSERVEGQASQLKAETEAAREAVLAEARALLESPPPLQEHETLEVLQSAVDAARTTLETASAEDKELAQLAFDTAEKRLAIRAGEVVEDASAATRRAELARGAAEATRAAGAKEDKALATLRQKLIGVQGAVAEVYEEEAIRRESFQLGLNGVRQRMDERVEAGANAVALPPLDPNRQSTIDRAYLDLRSTVRAIYEELDKLWALERADGADSDVRLALLEGWTGSRGSVELAKLSDGFDEASAGLNEALDNRDRARNATRDEVYRLLDVARDNRRVLKAEASSAARAQARRDFFPELSREVGALPGQLAAAARGLGLSLLAVPSFLGNVDAVWTLLLGSFELVVVVGLWGVGRRQMPMLMGRALDAIQQRLGAPLEGEREPAVVQLSLLGVSLLDLFTAMFMFSRLSAGLGVVGLLLLLWIARSATRAGPLLARCGLASPEHVHPSLRLVTAPTENLAARSLWWVAAWAAWSRVGTYAMVELLDADRLRDMVATLSSLAFWLLLLAFLMAWGPVAVATLAKQAEHSPVTGWASKASGTGMLSRLWNLPRYFVALGVVTAQLTIHIFGRLIEGRAALGWLQAALARRQLKSDEAPEVALAPAPAVVTEALERARLEGLPREAVHERLRAGYDDWKKSGRRGLVSLIGDIGSGKAQTVRRLGEILDTEVTTLEVTERITDPADVVRFLATGLGLQATTTDELIEQLGGIESRTIAVKRAHLLFLRCVRGYAPLQTLVTVMTSTADRHFWVLSVHEPSWEYLMGIAARLKLDAFRDHVRLEGADGPDLAVWLEEQTRATGLDISYEGLATTGLLGGDEGLAERRARSAYWRLLSDAAGGVPSNAVDLWSRSLSLGEAGKLDVRMFDSPDADDIQHLSDELLFTLKSLIQHERLTSDEMALVLNRRPAAARAAAKLLVNLDLAAYDAASLSYTLPSLWSPAVSRLLRQKHFLYAE